MNFFGGYSSVIVAHTKCSAYFTDENREPSAPNAPDVVSSVRLDPPTLFMSEMGGCPSCTMTDLSTTTVVPMGYETYV
jgi:hypothetical protein